MIRTLFSRGLRQHAGLLGILSVGLFFFEWAIVWVASRIEMGPVFRQLMSALFPPGVVETLFGQFGFASFRGAISFGYQHPLSLVAGIAIVTVMATGVAHERETGFLDLVLARPLSRTRYLSAEMLLVGIAAVLPPLSLLAGGAAGLAVVPATEEVSWREYLPSAVGLALLLLAVGAYILLFSTGAKRRGIAIAQAVGVTVLFYWLDFMGDYWDLLQTARYLSPFHFFDPAKASQSGLVLTDTLVLAGIVLTATVGAFANFRRQDL